MATDHGIKPAKPASCTLTSTTWPIPSSRRSRSRTAATAPIAPYTDAQSWARSSRTVARREIGEPRRPQRARRRERRQRLEVPPARGPLSPRSASATCTRCGWRSIRDRRRRRRSRPARRRRRAASSSAPSAVVPVDHHAALVGVAVGVREGVRWVRRLDPDHVGAEVGEDAGAQRASQIGDVDALIDDKGPTGAALIRASNTNDE